ncbi:MAG: PilZ domain-containing protein [Gammaproteobacteria bacterium]|nr:PilZ domain-containing protein [Gammaproteobacteria bacterium]
MENMPEFNNDRREFFRINDTVFVEISAIDGKELQSRVTAISNPIPDEGNLVQQQLDELTGSLTRLIDQISQSDRETARALRILDEKVNLVARSVQHQNNIADHLDTTDVNLSGGGIAFLSADKYQTKSPVEIRIELSHSGNFITAIANVISCDKEYDAPKETPYYLRLAFSHMSEHDRNALVKHTLSRQAQILRLSQSQNS